MPAIEHNASNKPRVPNEKKEQTEERSLYGATHDIYPSRNASQRYLIFSPQRTGSTYLCRRLCNIKGRFGLPSEYLHPKAIQTMSKRLMPEESAGSKIPLGKYMRAVERARTTEDGYFGIKVQPAQLLATVGRRENMLPFLGSFNRIILITRRDKLGQAISGAIAQATGTWFNDGTGASMDAAHIAAILPQVAQNLSRYIDEEQMILNAGKMTSRPLLRIEYEDIERDGETAFRELVDFLAGGKEVPLEEEAAIPVPEKQPSDLANTIRERFLNYISGR